MCITLIAAQKSDAASYANILSAVEPTSCVPVELVARCARQALAAIPADTWDASRVRACVTLLEAEVIPQAVRWHRRDLVPALLAAWRAVVRALARRAGPVLPPTACQRAATI